MLKNGGNLNSFLKIFKNKNTKKKNFQFYAKAAKIRPWHDLGRNNAGPTIILATSSTF